MSAFDLGSSANGVDSLSGDDIVAAARSRIGSLGYRQYGYSNQTPSGVPKDYHFIADSLDDAGLGVGDDLSRRPSAADWANPDAAIPGWSPVTDGSVQAGDVVATAKSIPRNWYEGGGQQLAIATGDGTSVGIVDNNRIGESDFGFQRAGRDRLDRIRRNLSESPAGCRLVMPMPGLMEGGRSPTGMRPGIGGENHAATAWGRLSK